MILAIQVHTGMYSVHTKYILVCTGWTTCTVLGYFSDLVWKVQQKMEKEKCCFCLARNEHNNRCTWGSLPANYAILCEDELDLRMIRMTNVFTHGIARNLIYAWYASLLMIPKIYACENLIYAWYPGLHRLRMKHVLRTVHMIRIKLSFTHDTQDLPRIYACVNSICA
jgi:hypothetical protein